MKTLRDLQQYLKTHCTAQVEVFNNNQKTTFSLEMWSDNHGVFDLRIIADGKLGETITDCTFLKLQEMIDQYQSWWIRPMDVAVNNFHQGVREWIETDEETYDEMLCVLPPEYHRPGVFAVGEPKTHKNGIPIFYCFKRDDQNRYWVQLMSVEQLKTEE